jgi:hypothetical protein
LPLGFEVGSLPAARELGKPGSPVFYTFKADKDSGTLRLNRKLAVDMLLLDQKYYAALRNFFQAVRTSDEEQVMLQPIASRSSK